MVHFFSIQRLPVRGTREYRELQTRISRALRSTEIAQVPGFEDVQITKFKGTDRLFGEFEAEMLVVVNRDEYQAKPEDAMTVEKAIKSTVNEGRVGNLKVEPESLKLRAPVEVSSSTDGDASGDSEPKGWLTTKMIIILACLAALVFIALVQASCTLYKMAKKPSVSPFPSFFTRLLHSLIHPQVVRVEPVAETPRTESVL